MLQDRLAEVQANVKPNITKFQNMLMEIKTIVVNGKKAANPYSADLVTSAETLEKNVETLVRILNRLLSEKAHEKEFPKLLNGMESADATYEKLRAAALGFGYIAVEKANKKRPRK